MTFDVHMSFPVLFRVFVVAVDLVLLLDVYLGRVVYFYIVFHELVVFVDAVGVAVHSLFNAIVVVVLVVVEVAVFVSTILSL